MIITGLGQSIERDAAWTEAAEEFLRSMNKLGVQMTLIGPKLPRKFGTKKTVRLFDRHEVVGMKVLAASRSHRLEFRILNKKTRAWTRLRAEACVTFGTDGVWPATYEGWTLPGTLTIDSLSRWIGEQKWVPGREFVFLGSTNQAVRWASILLDRGARNCYVVEPENELRCWRAHRDRFVSKGGRVLLRHRMQKVEQGNNSGLVVYLNNEHGRLMLNCDTVVLNPVNESALNEPSQWKKGLFYVHRRRSAWDSLVDEEPWLERIDWRETFWRAAKVLEVVDHSTADGALKQLRADRRAMRAYRNEGNRKDFTYSGKILSRESLQALQTSVSVPRSFEKAKPVASLECFENVPCRACADACPENAIEITRITDLPKLLEDKCAGCGACVAVCPAGAAVMVRDLAVQQKARYFFPDDSKEFWKAGKQVQLLNRKGDVLGTGRVVSAMTYENAPHRVLEVESTNVHAWEARGFRDVKPEFVREELEEQAASPVNLKRSWVTLNGVRRLVPTDVPITVALWQLGQRRFEDALFCHDGSCRLCEVLVDGTPRLACRTLVHDGQKIELKTISQAAKSPKPLCPCKGVTSEEYNSLQNEGVPEEIAREITGLGQGPCHGRWCLSSREFSCSDDSNEKVRPRFHGYEASPWRDLWAEDVAADDEAEDDF